MKRLFFGILLLSAKLAIGQTAVTNTGILYVSTGSDIFTAGGDFTNNSGAALTNNGQLYVKGNLSNGQASMATGTGTLYLNGTSAQSVNGSQPFRTYNFNSNNTAGITLNNNLSVSGTHTYTNGLITTSATPNYLIYEAGSSYTGSNDARHVNGWVKKIGSTNFTFPVGNATYERNITLSGLTASSEFNVQYLPSTPNINSKQLPIRSVNWTEYWSINKVSGGSASVTMNWDRSKVYFPNWILSDIRAAEWNGSLWTDQGGSGTGDINTTGTVTSNSVSSFNLFVIGSITWVLPVTLVDFTAKREDNHTTIAWSTAGEFNVKHFVIERSDDGRSFYTIAQVAARNSGRAEQYETRDNAAIQQTAWYRLRTIDNDGKESMSRVVSVSVQGGGINLTLMTNPVHDQVRLLATPQLSGSFQYQLNSVNGQVVQQGTLTIQNGGQYDLPLKGNARPGTYMLRVYNTQYSFVFKLIVQ